MNSFKQLSKYVGVGALAFIGAIAGNTDASAQLSYPYSADFETATCIPSTSSYASTDPIQMNGVSWVMPGMFLGASTDADKKIDLRSGRLRLTDNGTGDPGSIYTAEDFTLGVGTFSFYAADYGTEDGSTLDIQYSTDGGATWTTFATLSSEDITSEISQFEFEINQPGNVRLKLLKDAGNKRVNLDNFSVTAFADPSVLMLLSKSPVGTDIPLSTSSLSLNFSSEVALGTGTLTVVNADAPTETQTFSIPSTDVTVSGTTVTVNGLELENFTSYYVTLTEGAFTKATDASVVNDAITSPTDWTFMTVDTTPAPALTELDETFSGCVSSDLTELFNQYSVVGPKIWQCTTFGNTDENAVRINGGSATGVSEANEDWLITNNPYNVTSLTAPKLNFFMKRRFDGELNLTVKVSTDYIGSGDPTLATWTNIAEITTIADSNAWVASTGHNLASLTSNFYIAFVYTCGETGAIELSLDDVKIASSTSSIDNVNAPKSTLQVLGQSSTDRIDIKLNSVIGGSYTIQVVDINGRVMNEFNYQINAGENNITLSPLNLSTGLYIIRAIDTYGQYIQPVKAIVK